MATRMQTGTNTIDAGPPRLFIKHVIADSGDPLILPVGSYSRTVEKKRAVRDIPVAISVHDINNL